MKLTFKTILILLLLAVIPVAFAQSRHNRDRYRSDRSSSGSGDHVPGPTDYEAFSGFIGVRNIFDPNRQPHYSGGPRPVTRVRADAPFLSLVGIMSYDKGVFAFFNGNDEDLKQVVTVSGKIDHYTVAELTTSSVKLVSNDKKETLDLKVGDVLRQIDGQWKLTDNRDMPEETGTDATASAGNSTSTDTSTSPADSSATTPSSADEPNAVLKHLMELRAKENQ